MTKAKETHVLWDEKLTPEGYRVPTEHVLVTDQLQEPQDPGRAHRFLNSAELMCPAGARMILALTRQHGQRACSPARCLQPTRLSLQFWEMQGESAKLQGKSRLTPAEALASQRVGRLSP
jgi:hypothetical protein